MNKMTSTLLRLLLVLALAGTLLPLAAPAAASSTPAPASLGGPEDGLLQYTSGGHALSFAADGVSAATGTHAYRVEFAGAARVRPEAGQNEGQAAARAGSGLPQLERVTYAGLWPGIDLAYDAPAGTVLRSTYTLAPGADPAAIRLRYNAPPEINPSGALDLRYPAGALQESAPIAWQEQDGQRIPVAVEFQLLEGPAGPPELVGFKLGAYDPARALTIDPAVVGWTTWAEVGPIRPWRLPSMPATTSM